MDATGQAGLGEEKKKEENRETLKLAASACSRRWWPQPCTLPSSRWPPRVPAWGSLGGEDRHLQTLAVFFFKQSSYFMQHYSVLVKHKLRTSLSD